MLKTGLEENDGEDHMGVKTVVSIKKVFKRQQLRYNAPLDLHPIFFGILQQ